MNTKRHNFVMNLPRAMAILIAGLLTLPSYAQSQDASYLVLLNQNGKQSKNFSKDVELAGGTIKVKIDQIGVAFVSSANPDFKATLARARGVQGVAYSLPALKREDIIAFQAPQVETAQLGENEEWFPLQWGLDAVRAPQAWAAGATGAGVRVAVLDSGIDHDNVDLVPNLNQVLSRSFLACEEVWVEEIEDFVPNPNCVGDFEDWRIRETNEFQYDYGWFFNHGTHVAGTIAAADLNGAGQVVGVAPDAEIVAIKVCTEFATWCTDEAILPGIIYAADIGADIINMSIGGITDRNPSEICKQIRDEDLGMPCGEVVSSTQALHNAYRRAFQYANRHNTTVIVAAANNGLDADHTGSLLFHFGDFPNVLGISALGPIGIALPAIVNDEGDAPPEQVAGSDTLASYSNYGRSIIDFGAPGGNVDLYWSLTDPNNTMCERAGFVFPCHYFDQVVSDNVDDSIYFASGTSMAAPHAAGVAAIIVGLNGGDMTPQRLRTAMKRYADDLGTPGHDETYGDGRVNAGAATE
jgi:subtilisin family serine protease